MSRNAEAVQGSADADGWFAMGRAAAFAGKSSEAKRALLRAVELAPSDLQRAIDAGQLLCQAGCPSEGEQLFRRVLAEVPTFVPLRAELVRLLLDVGNDEAARSEAEQAHALAPGDISIRLLAAEANLRTGNRPRAADHLCEVIRHEPDNLEANRKLAPLLQASGQRLLAMECWRRVIDGLRVRDPHGAHDAMTALAIELTADGQHGEAIELLTAVARGRGGAPAHANLGMAELAAGATDAALASFERALAVDPTLAQAHCGLGLAHQKLGTWSAAAESFRTTERLAPDNPAGPFNLALVLQATGDLAGALRALERALALAPDDDEIRQAHAAATRAAALVAAPDKPASYRASGPRPSSPAVDASIAGDLRSFQLTDVLELLRMQHKSGSLVVSSRHGAGLVRLVNGSITSASAPGVPHLGQVLVGSGLIDGGQLEDALEHQRASGDAPEALGALLLRERLIDEAQLSNMVFAQVLEALGQMSTWTEGAFSFHRDQHAEPPPVSFSVPEVVLEVMRRQDERAAEREREERARQYLLRSEGARS